MNKTTINANMQIKAAMRRNERDILVHIRRFGKVCYERSSLRYMKAIDRLDAKGLVRYSKKDWGYVRTNRVGR